MTSTPFLRSSFTPLWTVAQWLGLGLTAVLLAGLVYWPEPTLHILWDMVIPLLPAVFLINPLLWRNACPLATLNAATGGRAGAQARGGRSLAFAWAVGIVLLAVMVPARRFLFNVNGPVLAATIVVVAALALSLGIVFSRRAGFCNAVCPVLPVEKLYGQMPLVQMGTPRCADCNLCTPVGCIDLAGRKTTAQTLGPTRRGHAWLVTPFGAFAAAFPGFVIGYFTTENVEVAAAGGVYLHVGTWAATSYLAAVALALGLRVRAAVALPVLGALAVTLYYWLGAPTLAKAYGVPDAGPTVIRAIAILLVGAWLWKGRGALEAGSPKA